MYKFAICDDDAEFCKDFGHALKNILLKKEVLYSLKCFYSSDSFLTSLKSGEEFDLIFLDVKFGNENGINLAKILRKEQYNSDIVFITGYEEYAVDSYDVEPLHYILKSRDLSKLETALQRFLNKNNPVTISLKTSRGMSIINISNILCFEIFSHDIIIHMVDGKKETCHGTLKQVEQDLPPMCFVRPHRSYLVNLDCISKIECHSIHLENGMSVPLSKSMYNKIQLILMEHLGKKNMFI